jgi:SAM-dependent methyltransferase
MFHPEGPTLLELAEQAMTSVERGYDLLARKFDRTPFRTPDAILDRVFADRFAPGSVGSAADLCCGTGAALARLRPVARDRVVGVDLSTGMLARAREAAERAPGESRVALFHQDVLRYDPAWGQVELATCFGAFGHILPRDEPRLIETIRALLVPGGRFVFVTAEGPPSPREAAFWLAHGFNAVMRARNAVWSPPFVMYYLTFLLPRARALLEARGFELEVVRGLFDEDNARYVLVVATRT